MAQTTAIEWTDVSWNPVHGCSIVSTECRHCYAQTLSLRYGQTLKPWTPANAAENVILKPHKLREPFSGTAAWRGLGPAAASAGKTDGKLVFVNSMSDLFHEQVPDEFIDQIFAVMALASRHTFQVLTKRPDRMRDYLGDLHPGSDRVLAIRQATSRFVSLAGYPTGPIRFPLPNVWLGTSIGLRHFVRRADLLRDTPAAVRFISAEPLLGPLVRSQERCPMRRQGDGQQCIRPLGHPGDCSPAWGSTTADFGTWPPDLDLTGIDWLIVGGESGPEHRRMDVQWARDLRDACLAQGLGHLRPDPAGRTAFFFKQWGGARPGGARELDGRTWDEFPRPHPERVAAEVA